MASELDGRLMKVDGTTDSSAFDPTAPRAAWELDRSLLRAQFAILLRSRLFWVGLLVKLVCSCATGSHFATRWFAPFAYEFVHGGFANPFATFLARGEPAAFPYGPGMLLAITPSFLPAVFFDFAPSGHLALFLLRVPLLLGDVVICVLLMRWLRIHARDVIVTYWLSPVVLYATYVHGQLDLIPTAIFVSAIYLLFTRRIVLGSLVFGIALATKAHLLIAAPFLCVYLFRTSRRRREWLRFALLGAGTAAALYAGPLTSSAFRTMVLGSAEARKLWALTIPYGSSGLVLYVAPAALLIAFLRFSTYRKLNRDLALMFIGAVYVGLVALVPPQPGWFIWSIPFLSYFAAQYTRTGPYSLWAVSSAYVAYFFISDPRTFLEAFDPVLGRGAGEANAARLLSVAGPALSKFGASVAWTILFSAVVLVGFLMYRRGVRSNSIYDHREESFMIGIAGDSGAGKHTIGRDLAAVMGDQISLINGDDNHKWERGHAMWRRYTHLDPRGNLLREQLRGLASLRDGRAIRQRHYDHSRGRFTDPVLVEPNDFMCVIGLHPFYLASQRELLHLKVFVDTDESLRREWKVERDMAKRGYSRETVIAQIEQREGDSLRYVRPQAQHADVVVRHMPVDAEGRDSVHVELVFSGALDPMLFLDAIDSVETLEVEWTPDEGLVRDRFVVRGSLDEEQLRLLAALLVPNVDEVAEMDEWRPGGRGVVQLAILHGLSARLRGGHAQSEAFA